MVNANNVAADMTFDTMRPKQTAQEWFQTIPSDVLAAAARGELDLHAVARAELASRGLNWQAKWIGFPAAAELAKRVPVRGANGRVMAVSVPE
jgi:hypothetical protein